MTTRWLIAVGCMVAACAGPTSATRRAPRPHAAPAMLCAELRLDGADARYLGLTPDAEREAADLARQLRLEHAGAQATLIAHLHQQIGDGAAVEVELLEEGRVVRARSSDAAAAQAGCVLAREELDRRSRELAQRALGLLAEQLGRLTVREQEARGAFVAFEREHGTREERAARRAAIARELEAIGAAARGAARAQRERSSRQALELDTLEMEAARLSREAHAAGDLVQLLERRYLEEQHRRDHGLGAPAACSAAAPCRAQAPGESR